MKKLLFIALLCVSSLFAKDFAFTAIPDQDETKLKERFSLLADYLSKELGVNAKFIPVKSYSASIAAFRNNQVQLAWFGGLSGVRARLIVPNAVAIAQGVEDPNFHSFLIANTSTGLEKSENVPAAIEGKTFTFGSKGSTSGRLMPEYFIRQAFNKAPEDIFSKVGFSGNHSKTIALVQSGAYEVGAVNYKVWHRELKEGKIDTSKVKIIYQTPGYPDYQFTARGDLDATYGEGFTKKLQEALIAIKDEKILNAFPRSGFIKASNKDFEPVLETGRKIGIID
ncbi:putative selenate ABC transporter substrate-binding protein [Halarcobacter bivalviorum]|uniref:Selenate ABC transporter substrate-binding protein n=1 Tax=Halarcobacter bivalviorum TaxID=663364 RepID=A0AAX2AAK3_9BACT|nr:putative selenate ABC transporter substrate-binding protein [Halarcobacter bivalviorum]AXH12051.1 putative selenate ABC transporter, substrate-binding protein [Halarcobacter bivalviorum]RXK11163.1 putative selenate ABC transporter substrate-binding protein [Halarcobacter bivalviorum]